MSVTPSFAVRFPASSNVNVFGKIIGDPLVFKNVKDGSRIFVEKV